MGIAEGNRGHRRPGQPAPRRDRIAAAMSWLANCVIEGFAAYAHSHAGYASFADTGESQDFKRKQWNEAVRGTRRVRSVAR